MFSKRKLSEQFLSLTFPSVTRTLLLRIMLLSWCYLLWPIIVHGEVLSTLDGYWHFRTDPQNQGEREGWYRPGTVSQRQILVPGSWEVAFADLRNYQGTAWYEKDFTVSPQEKDRKVFAVFQAVSWNCKVWINGRLAGAHEGGYLPFRVDLTNYIRFGRSNTLTLNVTDVGNGADVGSSWDTFMKFSGIWRDVWIETRGQSYVSNIAVTPDVDSNSAQIEVDSMEGKSASIGELQLTVTVKDPGGIEVFKTTKRLRSGGHDSTTTIKAPIDRVQLWDMDHPSLYTVEASLTRRGERLDSTSTDFGMRKISTLGKQLLLNGKPIYLRSGLDFLDYPNRNFYLETYRPLTDADIKGEITRWKGMGFNAIREFGLADPRYLYWADRLGVLISEEPGCACWEARCGPVGQLRFRDLIRGMIKRDYNHPSIIIWTLHNEDDDLGQADNLPSEIGGPLSLEILKNDYELAKGLDQTRLVIDNSGGLVIIGTNNMIGNHPYSDVDDHHWYYYMGPEWHPEDEQYVASIAARGRPFIFSEMLALTYPPDMDEIRTDYGGGQTPWWFYLPSLPGVEKTNHEAESAFGYEKRFKEWQFAKVFGGMKEFAIANEWRDFSVLKYEIEQMRKNPDITGYVYTQMNQQPGQGVVGILGEFGFGKKRVFADLLPMVNSSDVVFFDWSRKSWWGGEPFRADIYLSHFSNGRIDNAVVKWSLDGFDIHGEIRGVTFSNVGVQKLGEATFQVPATAKGIRTKLEISVEMNGNTIARNDTSLSLFPLEFRNASTKSPIELYIPYPLTSEDPMSSLRSRLGVGGYKVAEATTTIDAKSTVVLTDAFDDNVAKYVGDGGTAVLVVSDPRVLEKLKLTIGKNVLYWATGGWPCFIDKSFDLFSRIPFENPLRWEFAEVYPRIAIAGLSPENRPDIIGAGYGPWFLQTKFLSAGKVVEGGIGTTIGRFSYGNGRILVTTFRLLGPYMDDPIATIMLNDLIYYGTTAFKPTTSLGDGHEKPSAEP